MTPGELDSSIPEIWTKQFLSDTRPSVFTNFLGLAPPRPPLSRQRRLKLRLRLAWSDARERLARRIYPEGPWDFDPYDY